MALPPEQVFYVTPADINAWRDADAAVIVAIEHYAR